MPRQADDNFHSAEAQAILGKMPSWIVQWGVTVIFAIFAGILVGCYFIKYPDTVVAPVVITTINPPADLIVRYDGLIDSIYVRDKQQVTKGRLIATLRTAADWRDIDSISEHIATSTNIPAETLINASWLDDTYNLGELQSSFADFQSKCRDYHHYIETGAIEKKRALLTQQIAKNREYYSQLRQQRVLLVKDLDYQQNIWNRDSLLQLKKIISQADFETSSQNLLQKQNTKAGFDATLTSTQLQIIQSEQQLVDLNIQQQDEIAQYERDLNASRQQLVAQIAQWKQQYVLEAPADGKVTFVNYWSNDQHVQVGDKLASIVPAGKSEVIGRMQVPTAGFGKVKAGQMVNVKLNGFPYMEFGVLRGKIRSISAVPEQIQTSNGTTAVYIAEIVFPDGLTTTYKRDLPMIQQMDGTGEIITEDMRLISRFIQPIFSLFKNR